MASGTVAVVHPDGRSARVTHARFKSLAEDGWILAADAPAKPKAKRTRKATKKTGSASQPAATDSTSTEE